MEISFGKFRLPEGIWEFPIGDFLVLARPDVAGLYILNPSARFIWDTLKAVVPVAELVQAFAGTYDIPLEVAARDVEQTLSQWQSGLLAEQGSSLSAASPAPTGIPDRSAEDCFTRDYLIQGKSVRIILQTAELVDEIAPRLESLQYAPSAPDFTFKVVEDPDGFRIYCNEICVANQDSVAAARGILLQEIVRTCRGRDWLAVFHAGACGSNSRCVVFPAGTHSGKSTLAAVLMKMSLTFYSDDSVPLERDTLSVPVMPFGLMIREGSWDVLCPRLPELEDAPIFSRWGQRVRFLAPLGMKDESPCAQVGAIVFARFTPDAANEITALDPLHTLLRLQESGFWVAHDEQSIGAFLAWMESTPSFTLRYSDVDEAASMIRRLID
jgi:hypothetical protein